VVKNTWICGEPDPVTFIDIPRIAPPFFPPQGGEGGKSGQHRAPCFLTGRGTTGDGGAMESATERETADPSQDGGKDEKVG